MKSLTSILFFLILLASCNNTAEVQEAAADAHDHGAIFILQFERNMELFAEADQLYAGHGVEVRAHLTFLEDYSPAKNGILYARLVQGANTPDWEPLELEKPGIFIGSLIPDDESAADFEFMYQEDELEIVFVEKSLTVYTHADTPPEPPPHGDEVIFTKEQAWKTKFGLLPLKPTEFKKSIHCSGEICLNPASVVEIIAPATGKLAFNGTKLFEGSYVNKGALLFTILSTGLSHDNILIELNTARAEYEKSKANLERKEKLLEIDAVSRKDYEEAKSTFDQDVVRFKLLNSQVSESGMLVKSPVSGYITEVYSAENGFTQTGTVLLEIVKEGGMLIKANVPSNYSNSLAAISNANIKLPQYPDIRSIEDYGGKLVSYGRTIDPLTGMIPVYFSIDKSDLISGTCVELWLFTKLTVDELVIPGSSLLEEYGQYFVYVQEEGEAYEKRPIEIEEGDGVNYKVISGLEFGEVIVSKGGMAIKIANAMGAPPVHSH